MALHNLARVTSATTGTGTLTLGSAVSGFLTFADAGVVNGEVVTYAIRDGANSEIGRGTYTSAGTTLSRTTILESTNGGAAINCSGSQEVFVTAAAEDIHKAGQTLSYPSIFTGDIISGSSTSPFVDVAAFDTKEVLNSRILHLQTIGASKDHRVRVTLGTTKAAAFDIRICLGTNMAAWSASGDTYIEIRLSTSADSQIALARLYSTTNGIVSAEDRLTIFRVGGSGLISTGNYIPSFPNVSGMPVTMRFVRDGSNVISYYVGVGTEPMFLGQIITTATNTPYTNTVSGTLERIEIASHTPSGPAGGQHYVDAYVDYISSL